MGKRILHVSGFSRDTRARDVAHAFERYGRLVRCDIPSGRRDGTPFAFVEYEDSRDAADAYDRLHGQYVGNHRISVQWAKRPPARAWRHDNGGSRRPRSPSRSRSRSPSRHSRRHHSHSRSRSRSRSRDRRGSADRQYNGRERRRSRSQQRSPSMSPRGRDLSHGRSRSPLPLRRRSPSPLPARRSSRLRSPLPAHSRSRSPLPAHSRSCSPLPLPQHSPRSPRSDAGAEAEEGEEGENPAIAEDHAASIEGDKDAAHNVDAKDDEGAVESPEAGPARSETHSDRDADYEEDHE
ncbi:hypothetical protein LPJ66_003690 [Kickxella alabastrina]|uniref:Uncharacterized protein n=1 Tax=Kickxella alabastrina TaxID=61397 RepID=A0ACC1IMT3_9FUNG|nr:hypothetical protein LPJ66_003690 [Kickxella alabastrina]